MRIRAMKKQSQNKPNLLDAQMNISSVLTKDYENETDWTFGENKPNTKPIQTQSNPISPPHAAKQTQFKPNQTQFRRQKNAAEMLIAARFQWGWPGRHPSKYGVSEGPVCLLAVWA